MFPRLRDLDLIEAHRIAKTATRKEEERRKKGERKEEDFFQAMRKFLEVIFLLYDS